MQLEACRFAKPTDVNCCPRLFNHAPEIGEPNVAQYSPFLVLAESSDVFEVLLEVILVEAHDCSEPSLAQKT